MGSSGNYQIANSLRLRSSASAYLSRTFVAGNRKTWTWSGWVKRGIISSGDPTLFSVWTANSNLGYLEFRFSSAGDIYFAGWSVGFRQTTQVFRDPSAWSHIVLTVDTTQAVANDRVKLYVNGSQVTAFVALNNPALNDDLAVNQAAVHNLGREITTAGRYLDGYLSEVNFIDGQALTPASFGETDIATGSWVAKKYTGTYGTNGFYLPFSDATNLTTLASDKSGNANNWTATNVSLTAGATYDWMVDTPTNNYCTWNPLFPASLSTGTYTVSDANLKVADAATSNGGVQGTVSMDSGKWYWEVLCQSSGGSFGLLGIEQARPASGYPGGAAGVGYVYQTDGQKGNGAVFSAYGASYTTNDVVGVAFDAGSGQLTFYKNGVTQGLAYTAAAGTYFPAVGDAQNSTQYQWAGNFGQRPFTYTPPTGFKALCTGNLPAPAIANPKKHFDVVTNTGSGTTRTDVVAFQPDLVWTKTRNTATNGFNIVQDSVRGAGNRLITDQTLAEGFDSTYGSFTSTGFQFGANVNVNTNANTYVDWLWKANGAAVSNTNGSITSQVSANTTAGFSIVTYTGTGVNATVGHGLGVRPRMIIVKERSPGGDAWYVFHQSVDAASPEQYFLELNSTAARAAASSIWNNSATTSTVFHLGISSGVNENTRTYVAYCFAEVPGFSKIGSYTGNGSADGPFVWTGFRVRWVMVKRTDVAGYGWGMYDTARGTFNVIDANLYANSSSAESIGAANNFDLLSNGFKPRTTDLFFNASGGTYIFLAFAEAPFQTANAR